MATVDGMYVERTDDPLEDHEHPLVNQVVFTHSLHVSP